MEISAFKINNSTFEKFSGVHFNNRPTFKYYANSLNSYANMD